MWVYLCIYCTFIHLLPEFLHFYNKRTVQRCESLSCVPLSTVDSGHAEELWCCSPSSSSGWRFKTVCAFGDDFKRGITFLHDGSLWWIIMQTHELCTELCTCVQRYDLQVLCKPPSSETVLCFISLIPSVSILQLYFRKLLCGWHKTRRQCREVPI